jgi:hypothetical protein
MADINLACQKLLILGDVIEKAPRRNDIPTAPFLSTTCLRPIPHIPAKPLFCTIR